MLADAKQGKVPTTEKGWIENYCHFQLAVWCHNP